MGEINSLYTMAAHDAGAEMQLKDVSGKPLDVFITFVGSDSEKWDEIEAQFRTQQIEAIREGGIKQRRCKSEMLGAAALSWRGVESDGKPLEFKNESVVELFYHAPYIREQADLFIADRANFTKG